MTNSKKTKRALLSSVISLILCMSMLVGTTFAWFTDSVSSGKNQIVAGNLDIELEYLADGTWTKVTENTNVFEENTLWEPGHTEVVYLKIANVGTLDLKYQLGIHVFEEITSINAKGEEIKLSDHLEFGIIEGVSTPYAKREDARKALTASQKLSTGYSPEEGKLYDAKEAAADSTKPSEKYLAMVVYMPETVSNEANYLTGEVAPVINMGINLMATQLMSENDSFGNDYDEGAKFDAVPGATVTKLSKVDPVPLANLSDLSPIGETVELDVAYNFSTTQTYEQAILNEYAKWHVDFEVTFSKDVKAGSLVLGGYYASWCNKHNNGNWLAFPVPENIPANTPVRLLEFARISMNYEEMCLLVQDFQCGAVDLTGENAGTTMTAKLCGYEVAEPDWETGNSWNIETGVSEVFGVYTYTFPGAEDAPVVEIEAETVENQEMLIYGEGLQNITLKEAYTFTAQDTAETVQESPYKDWIADYYVTLTNEPEEGLILAGTYGTYGWIGFEVPLDLESYTNVGLLELATVGANTWTYADIVNQVGTFTCGAVDTEGKNAGSTLIVELRLTNPAEPTDTILVSHIQMPL